MTQSTQEARTQVVYIAGQRYAVRTDAQRGYLERLAAYVEERYREILGTGRSIPVQKAAMLTALRLADELFREREEKERLKENIRLRSQKILGIIESLQKGRKTEETKKEKPLLGS